MVNAFSKFINVALVGCVMTGTLVGCQPTSEQPASATDHINDADHATHSDEEHSETMEYHNERAGDDHSEHAHDSKITSFNCEPEAAIGVYYHSDDTPQTAHLLIDGIEYDLSAINDSITVASQTYSSDIGLDDTHGLIWQVDGNSAILRNKTLDGEVATQDETVLYQCAISS